MHKMCTAQNRKRDQRGLKVNKAMTKQIHFNGNLISCKKLLITWNINVHTEHDIGNIHWLKFKVGHNAWSNIFPSNNQICILNQDKKLNNRPHASRATCHVLRCLFMSYTLFPIYPVLLIYNLLKWCSGGDSLQIPVTHTIMN